MSEWFDDENLWKTTYPYMFPDDRLELGLEQVEQLLELVSFQGDSVLDLCCGPGRHSVALASRGLKVTGVDKTPFLLSKARERAAAAGVQVEWVHQDMRDFVRPDSFDLIINLFTSFGYFDDKDEDLKVLANIYQSLKAGGVLVIDVVGKERLAKIFLETSSEKMEDGTFFVQRREIYEDWTRIRNEWLLIKDDHIRRFYFHHTVYSGQELKDRLLQAGFDTVLLYGDFSGAEYGREAARLVAVARKA